MTDNMIKKIVIIETELMDKDEKSRYLGVYFRDIRLALGKSTEYIANILNITEEELVDIEVGERRFYRCEDIAIQKILDIDRKITSKVKLLSGPVKKRNKYIDAIRTIEVPEITLKYSKDSKNQGLLIAKARRKSNFSLAGAVKILGISFNDLVMVENGELLLIDYESAIEALVNGRFIRRFNCSSIEKKDLVSVKKSADLLIQTKSIYEHKNSSEEENELRAIRNGIRIRKARRNDISIKYTAEKLGVSVATLAMVEEGELEFVEYEYVLDTIRNIRIEYKQFENLKKFDGNYFCTLRRRNKLSIKEASDLLCISVEEYSAVEDFKTTFVDPCSAEKAIKTLTKTKCKVKDSCVPISEQLKTLISDNGLKPAQIAFILGISKSEVIAKNYNTVLAVEKIRKWKR